MTSVTSNDVCGWTPLTGEDEDVIVSQDFMTTINTLPSSVASGSFLTSTCPPLDTASVPHKPTQSPLTSPSDPVPLISLPRTTMAPSSDRRAQRNRSRDPGWIPRPRNAFIIFRCDYSREHLQSSQESEDSNDSNTSNPTAKTLSKRAADAWKQLPPSERDRYKLLADREREEHARTYPHYRFRPMRRHPSGGKKTFQVVPQGARGTMLVEPLTMPLTRLPSVLAPSAQKLVSKAQNEEPPTDPQPSQYTQQSVTLPRRRSSSAPNAELLSISPVVPSHRGRRSNSVIEKAKLAAVPPPWQVTAAPSLEHSSYGTNPDADPSGIPTTVDYDYSSSYFASPPEVTFEPVYPTDRNGNSIHIPSPLTSATSSLIGWNGEFGPPSPVALVHISTSPAEVPQSVSSSPQTIADDSCPLWAPSVGIPSDAFLYSTAGYEADPSYGDPERARALEAYTLGLYNYDLFTGASPLFPEGPLTETLEDENAAIFPNSPLGV